MDNKTTQKRLKDVFDSSRISHSHKLFFDKRLKSRLTYDCSITINFSPYTEWNHSERKNESIAFGINEANLYVELQNGVMCMRDGDKLGTAIQMKQETVVSKSNSVEKITSMETQLEGSVGKGVSVKAGQKSNAQYSAGNTGSVEVNVLQILVTGNFSLEKKPMWTFRSNPGPIAGHLADRPLFTVRTEAKGPVLHSSWIEVNSKDVVIFDLPKHWTTKLRFKSLLKATLRKNISEYISMRSSTSSDSRSLEPS